MSAWGRLGCGASRLNVGGVRTLDALLEVMALGTTRIGATATKTIIDDFRARKAGRTPATAGAQGAGESGAY